jgi:hypothetical protein
VKCNVDTSKAERKDHTEAEGWLLVWALISQRLDKKGRRKQVGN